MQPLFKAAARESDEAPLRAASRSALHFFRSLLGTLEPAEFEVVPASDPPVLVWTDGKYEADDDVEPAAVGVLVAWPKPRRARRGPPSSLADMRSMYVFEHARAAVPDSFMDAFITRKQYIGQIEILAGLCAYTSFGRRLRGRHVMHFVDNTSALAGMARGYAGPTDSRRLVHALHTLLSALRVKAWFEYVPSKANPSDAPSRVPGLRADDWWIDDDEQPTGLRSAPHVLLMPAHEAWGSSAAAWAAAARGL